MNVFGPVMHGTSAFQRGVQVFIEFRDLYRARRAYASFNEVNDSKLVMVDMFASAVEVVRERERELKEMIA